MAESETWQWILGTVRAFLIGVAKTGMPGMGALIVPLMVLTFTRAKPLCHVEISNSSISGSKNSIP